jgi:hypothetical protein
MIETFEEISRAVVDSGIIVVKRKLFVSKNIYNFVGISEEELAQERLENNGRTLSELHTLIRMNIYTFGEFTLQRAELKIKGLQTASKLIFDNPGAIKSTLLSELYMDIEDWIIIGEDIFLETNEQILWEYIQLLNDTKKKIEEFYLCNPYRALELSDDISERILTTEACLTSPFLPYITRELATPRWMVPRTVRTLNDACRIYQTREFIKKEGMKLFLLLACDRRIPLILWKMIAYYAIDMRKIRFQWFEVVTEKMLKNRHEYLKGVQIDLFSFVPTLILTV